LVPVACRFLLAQRSTIETTVLAAATARVPTPPHPTDALTG